MNPHAEKTSHLRNHAVDPLRKGCRLLKRETRSEESRLEQEIRQIPDRFVCFVLRDFSPELLDDRVLGVELKCLL